jgi:hypothetical protein
MVSSSHLEYFGYARNCSGRKAIKVQGRGWNTSDIFKEFYVFHEFHQYEKAPRYDVLRANETNLEDLQPGNKTCFALFKDKDEVKNSTIYKDLIIISISNRE